MTSRDDTLTKARSVGRMFDRIAGRYDLLNRLMSAGQDGRWRQAAVRALAPLPPGPLLDIGVGTGDLAFEMRRLRRGRDVAGIDLSRGMMDVARAKCAERGEGRIALAQGDVLRLPFVDGSFAGAATAFTFRNVADLAGALAEVHRVLKPGAPFAILEITRPRGGLMARLFRLYFQQIMPRFAGIISGDPGAYRYLPQSVERFVTGEDLAAAMHRAGFTQVRMRRFWPGAVTLHVGRVPAIRSNPPGAAAS